VSTQVKPRVHVHIRVDERIDTEIGKIAAMLKRKGFDKTDIYELSARILLAILKSRKIPDDLGEVLAKEDPEALDQLRELIEKLRGC